MKTAINWFEIAVSDMDRAKTFYEAILDTELHDFTVGDDVKMALFPTENGGIGGALVEYASFYTPSEHGALIYINANPDLAEAEKRVEKAGGEVLISKRMISREHGYMAVIKDTEGNRVGLHSNS